MFSVFIAFVFQDDSAIKSMGIALGFRCVIRRMTLIPIDDELLVKLHGTFLNG